MLKLVLSTLLVSYLTYDPASAATDKVICYYRSWSSSFSASDIDTTICTHINFAFLGIKSDGSLFVNDAAERAITALQSLKRKNSKLKLLFSVGGGSASSKRFSLVADDSIKLYTMASSALEFLKTYKFDGIDIDWEYPAQKGGKSSDKTNFINMLKTLRKKLKNSSSKYLLTVAVGSIPYSSSYYVSKLVQYVDFINVMTYDFHTNGGETGENSPLYPRSGDSNWSKKYASCDAAINNWKGAGAPSRQLVLGLAFYGHSFRLKDSKNHGIGAPINGDNGQLGFNKICILKNGWTEVWDDEQKVPYKYKEKIWIGFDNPQSIKFKVQYAKEKQLGGVMVWAVDLDDTSDSCGAKFALLKEIKKNL